MPCILKGVWYFRTFPFFIGFMGPLGISPVPVGLFTYCAHIDINASHFPVVLWGAMHMHGGILDIA